jgi:outer membrane biogenesis lipoprotein LolB
MRGITHRVWLSFCLLVLFAGCAATKAPDASLGVSGRFSAKVTPSGDGGSGRFALNHSNAQSILELSTPFGQALARFENRAAIGQSKEQSTVWLAANQGQGPKTIAGESMEQLSQELLGWPVPVHRLSQWLLGLYTSDPGSSLGTLGLITRLSTDAQRSSQGGGPVQTTGDGQWQLEVQEWFERDNNAAPWRPRLLTLSNINSNNPTSVLLRLVVEEWH